MSSGFASKGLRQGYNALALLHSNAVCFYSGARERGGGRRSRFAALRRAKFWPHEGQVVGGRRSDAGALAWNVGSRHVRERVASNNELYGIRRGASWQCGWEFSGAREGQHLPCGVWGRHICRMLRSEAKMLRRGFRQPETTGKAPPRRMCRSALGRPLRGARNKKRPGWGVYLSVTAP